MIARLRRRHRHTVLLSAGILPLGVVLALLARPDPADVVLPVAPLAVGVGQESLLAGAAVWQRDWEAAEAPLSVTHRSAEREALLELRPVTPLRRPDVLVYWSSTPPAAGEGPPPAAHLLGRVGLGPTRHRLPPAARGTAGHLTLYSLAHQERLGTLDLATDAGGRP